MPRISNEEFIESMNKRGREIMSQLALIGKGKSWLARILEISNPSMDKRLKGQINFSDEENKLIDSAIKKELKKL